MMTKNIQVEIIPQLKDNYSYVIYSKNTKKALVLDPAEPKKIFDFLNSKNLSLEGILITHHHSDHTQGIGEFKKKFNVMVCSPKNSIEGTTDLLTDKQTINFSFIDFKIISAPGHTLDHIVYFNEEAKLLFCGDVLFYYGCGRIFEGTMEQTLDSLNKIKELPDDTKVYCGHEYTYKNLEFVLDELVYWQDKGTIKEKCRKMIKKNGSSMPFYLGHQKDWNPFLNCDDSHYKKGIANFHKNKGKISLNASELEFFTFIRKKRNAF